MLEIEFTELNRVLDKDLKIKYNIFAKCEEEEE